MVYRQSFFLFPLNGVGDYPPPLPLHGQTSPASSIRKFKLPLAFPKAKHGAFKYKLTKKQLFVYFSERFFDNIRKTFNFAADS